MLVSQELDPWLQRLEHPHIAMYLCIIMEISSHIIKNIYYIRASPHQHHATTNAASI